MKLTGSLQQAAWGLRTYRGSAVLLVLTGFLALAVALTIASLVDLSGRAPRFVLTPLAGWETLVPWGDLSQSAAESQRTGVETLFLILAIETLALLIVASLTILTVSAARAAARAQEVTVRRAVGASRAALIGGLLVESSGVAFAAVAMGAIAGALGARVAAAAWPGTLGPSTVLPLTLLCALIGAGLTAAGLLPAAYARRRRVVGAHATSPHLLVGALQLGIAMVALTGSALLERHARQMQPQAAPGTDSGTVVTIALPSTEAAVRTATHARLLDLAAQDPSIDDASLTSPGTLIGLGAKDVSITDCGRCAYGTIPMSTLPVRAAHHLISPDTFNMLGMTVLEGRGITLDDVSNTSRVAVVSRSLASGFFEGGRALGRQISIGSSQPMGNLYTVVGVVEDRAAFALGGVVEPNEAVYLSVLQHDPPVVDLLLRPASAAVVVDAVRAIRAIVGPAASIHARAEADIVAEQAAPITWFGRLLALVGWTTLLGAAAGAFAGMALWVASVRPTLGVMRAVGATRRQILRYVLVRAAAVGVAGFGLALWLGDGVWSVMVMAVPGLPAWNAETLLSFGLLLVVTAVLGAILPALRAATTPPALLLDADP